MSDLQQQIDALKSRHQQQLNQLSKSHNEQQIALTQSIESKLKILLNEKADSLFNLRYFSHTPEQKKAAIAQIDSAFLAKKKFLDQEKQQKKKELISQYEQKKNELKKKQTEELRKLRDMPEKDPYKRDVANGKCPYYAGSDNLILGYVDCDDPDGKKRAKKNSKKYMLMEVEYQYKAIYDNGTIIGTKEKRIILHESELKLHVKEGPLGKSWYDDVTIYTLDKTNTKEIVYIKENYLSSNPILFRKLIDPIPNINPAKDVKIDNILKIREIPCDRIIDKELMDILPYTSKLMSQGKAILTNPLWSSFLVDKVFGGLLQEKDLYDIPELTQKHSMRYIENVSMSKNTEYFDDLLKQSADDNSASEKLIDQDNIYNKIVNANNNILNLPARIIEKGQPVIKIPFGILWNFEMEADNDLKKFIAAVQQGSLIFQKDMFGFITDFVVKTLTDNLPSLGQITQGVLTPIEEKPQSNKPTSQSYFVPTAPVATAVTAGMQIAAIETIAQGTITTITGGIVSGSLLVIMAQQVTALIVELLKLPGLNLVRVAAGQAVIAAIKTLVFTFGQVVGKIAAKLITWTMIALMDVVLVGSAVLITQALKKQKSTTLADYAFILGINYGKPPDLHFFGLNQTNESDSHLELIEAAKTFKENTGKQYDRVIGYAIPKDLKTQPINKKEIGAVIDLTDDNAIVISGKELKMLYALQFMYLFENVDEMQIPDRACVILPPPP